MTCPDQSTIVSNVRTRILVLNRVSDTSISSPRRGLGMIELLMAAILLSTIFAIAVPVLRVALVTNRQNDRQNEALMTASNVLERLTLKPWDEITPDTAADIELPEAISRQLPDAELQVQVEPDGDAKRISVLLSWQGTGGKPMAPVRLTTWVYPTGEKP